MLYLIKQPAYDDEGNYIDILKIGFASDMESRFLQYLYHCPSSILLSQREGDKFMEKFLHLYFDQYKFPKLREWFYFDQEILDEFMKVEFNEEYCRKVDYLSLQHLFDSPRFSDYLKIYNQFSFSLEKITAIKMFSERSFSSLEALNFNDRIKLLYDYIKDHQEEISILPEKYKIYFDYLPLEKIESCSFRKDKLDDKLRRLKRKTSSLADNKELSEQVYKYFILGQCYSKKDIKSILTSIFSSFGLKAKASDIGDFYEVSRSQIKNTISGKYDEGYKIVKCK